MMMNKKTKYVIGFTAVILILTASATLNAQPLPTQHGGGSGLWVGGAAPIAGGNSIMLIASVLYGVSKYVKKRFYKKG